MVLILKELSPAVEEALVKCLEMCAEFQYPLKRKDLQDLVQSYVIEQNVQTRWVDDRPGREWVRLFQKRWSHRVKIRKPRNIKRSRAAVSPKIIRAFFGRLAPNLEGIPSSHVFNYDETCIQAGVLIFGKPYLALHAPVCLIYRYRFWIPPPFLGQYFPKYLRPCTVIKDDPGAKEAFFGGGSKYYEQIRNHSRVGFSVMFCIRWV
jgi:hypothetical protein